MSTDFHKKVIVLIICFLLASIFIYRQPGTRIVPKKISLQKALADIPGWQAHGVDPLDQKIVRALNLDDHINQRYSRRMDTVSLYVGFYQSMKKVGAAHDPLVCFPGQGWSVSERETGQLSIDRQLGRKIGFSSMVTELGLQRQFVVYWFQAYDRANPDTFSQKISLLWRKLIGKGEDNAFVRISINLDNKSLPEARETVLQFARSCYPVLLKYITETD